LDTDNKNNLSKLISDNQDATSFLKANRSYSEKLVVNTIKIYNGHNPAIKN